MNTSKLALVLVALLAVVSWGCNGGGSGDGNTTGASAAGSHDGHDHADHSQDGDATSTVLAATILCGDCGEMKGTEACCADGEKCEDCGKVKGTALCCVELSADAAGQDLCSACGHVAAADEHQCDGDCETCADCGLHKGAPLCCKLK